MSDLFCAARIVLARHGTAEFVEDVFSDEGGTLTLDGRRQAADLADSLTGEQVAGVLSSDLARAVQTAEIVAARLGTSVTTRKALREVHVGELTGRPFEKEHIEEVAARWRTGDLEVRFPAGESGSEVVARHRRQLEEAADQYRGETVLVIGHETALSITVPVLAGLPLDWTRAGGWDNCESVILEADADGWRLA